MHYLYSRQAFKYPAFFLHHWAKPLFVLLSAPFAQAGFKGIEIFNCLCLSLSALFTFYTARQLNIKYPYVVFVLLLFAPLCFKLVFSGLTEYLFALLLIAGLYCSSVKKHTAAAILISFLPMVRSEGLLIMGVFLVHFLLIKNYRAILFLALGQLIYSFTGAFYYKDFLWVFTKIPYANMVSSYGHGQLTDMANRLNYVIEKPIYLLLLAGLISIAWQSFKRRFKNIQSAQILVAATFLVFFIGHSIFWWKGIFNSLGLPRVFIGVMPVIALIALTGLQSSVAFIKNQRNQCAAITCIVLLIILYPFTYRPKGVVYNKSLFIVPGNAFVSEQLAPYLKATFPDYRQRRMYYNSSYLSMILNVDYFDENQRKDIHQVLYDAHIPANSVVIWDEWFSTTESGIRLEDLKSNTSLELVKQLTDTENPTPARYAIFKVKND